MKKGMIATIGLLFLLTGCAATGAKKASAKTTIATTETSTVASSVEKTSTTDSKVSSETKTSETQTTASSEMKTTETQSTTASSQTTDSSTTAVSSQPEVQTLWNANKASELAAFMSTWGQEMGQQYRSYNNSVNANYYGMPVPQAILDGEWTMVIDQTPVTVEWTENGTGQAGFQIAAVYSDAEHPSHTATGNIHLYFFGFQQNQPKVLVTQQNQGDPNKYLYFRETGNAELKNGFDQIVNS